MNHGVKVVKVRYGGSSSQALYTPVIAEAPVFYQPGKWTHPAPGDGPLCVFSEVEAARGFVVAILDGLPMRVVRSLFLELWTCEYIPADGLNVWYRSGRGRLEIAWLEELHPATRLARAVRLIDRIDEGGVPA